MKSPKDYMLQTRSLNFGVREWGNSEGLPVIALHGWLDNAASFDRVAPHLEGIRLIAIDHAGHAFSDPRPEGSHYLVWEYALDLVDVLETLKLDKVVLLGHSLGAIVATQFAATFPERIIRLGLIEGLVPMTRAAAEAPAHLAQYAKIRHRVPKVKPTRYPTQEQAIAARMKGFIKLKQDAATLLAARGVREADGGFYWHNDTRLKLPTAIRLDESVGFAFVEQLKAPTLLIIGEDSGYRESRLFPDTLPDCIDIRYLPGRHHLHLEESSQAVGDVMNRFLKGEVL